MTTSDLTIAPGLHGAEGAPLASAQERIWYLDRVVDGSTAHHTAFALRLTGELGGDALAWSLEELRRRHVSLRSGIRVSDGEPRQVVLPFRPRPLPFEDLAGGAAAEPDLRGRVEAELRHGFDLANGETTRWLLLRLAPDEHVLVQTSHRAFVDDASIPVLLSELQELYAARVAGADPSLAEPGAAPGEHARKEREWLAGPGPEDLLSWWREQLGSASGALELPLDRPRPPMPRFRGRSVSAEVAPGTASRLSALAREEGTSTFVAVLAAFQALLVRYTGRPDLVVGTITDGRTRPELQGLVGCLANTVAVRTDLSEDPPFREALRRAARAYTEALDRQAVPVERVAQALRPSRGPNRSPLVQVLCRPDLGRAPAPSLPELRVERLRVEDEGAYCDLDLIVSADEGGLHLALRYDRDLFEHATAERMVEHLEVLLGGIAEDPDRPLSRLPLLPAHEWHRVMEEWNGTYDPALLGGTLHELFERRARRTPDRTAVQDEAGGCLRYGELDARADDVARAIRARGVQPRTVVGVCADRSVDMVVALLGVLKAGAAYLPLDPEYPEERLAFMLEDSGASLVLSVGRAARALPRSSAVPVLAVEDVAPGAGAPDPGPADGAGPEDPAYVIYTSGSTGTPKGVVVPHRAAHNFLRAMAREPGLGEADRLLAVTTTAFDIALLELFLPLSVGAGLVVASRQGAADPRRLMTLVERHEIDTLQATPATWRMLVDAGWRGDPLLRVLCGGEAMSADLAAALLERAPEVWNLYGPTEATGWCTTHRVETAEDPVSIGRPVANATAYVLDGRMNPVPIGVTGELWIGGACVALGYHGREELTAERFVPDPFSDRSGARLYRTGDLARWRPDGLLAFHGRRDHQVKLRGYRIELGEVEAALLSLSEVRAAVAAVSEDGLGERRLVAWATFHAGQSLTGSEIRRRLRRTLPGHLIPSLVVELDELPLTPNGKIDRKALPDPLSGVGEPGDFEPPATILEKELARIWSDVLGVERVGAGDNFFDLGGHSLLCMRTVHRMESATGLPFDPRTMVLQTLRQIASDAESSA